MIREKEFDNLEQINEFAVGGIQILSVQQVQVEKIFDLGPPLRYSTNVYKLFYRDYLEDKK